MRFLLRTPHRLKWALSLYPPFLGTGIWVRSVSDDFREVVVVMRQHLYNRNAFGGHFGGSVAAMTDPFLTLMLIRVLGPDYRVIDAETRLRFLEQARGAVTARFVLEEEVLARIGAATAGGEKHLETFTVDITDRAGRVVARAEKTIYIRLRRELRPRATAPASDRV